MSGGVAYVFDPDNTFADRCNMSMVAIEPVLSSAEQEKTQGIDIWHSMVRGGPRETDDVILRRLVEHHFRYTGSFSARDLVSDWETARGKFVKVMPVDYKRALGEMWRAANPQPKVA
jgi:glutamate synthase (NADPH/NADH) large chain